MKVEAELKYYNANTRNAAVGDCVKRSLSVAFRMDYDRVAAELNAIKRKVGANVYNVSRVYNVFLADRGVQFRKVDKPYPTVEEFSQLHPVGTYLMLTGRGSGAARGFHDHMVCMIDGTVYDSWNSMQDSVMEYTVVRAEENEGEDEHTLDDIFDDIVAFVDQYCGALSAKCAPYCSVHHWAAGDARVNMYTRSIGITCTVLTDAADDYRFGVWYRKGEMISHHIPVKYNPRLTVDDNLISLKTKVKQKIYDWVYNIRKDLKDAEGARELQRHPEFHGYSTDLMKLPDWSRPYVTYFRTNGNPEYEDKFKVYMDALPEDPRANGSPEVYFAADTLRELKDQMADYKDRYLRLDYDY